MSLMEAMYGYYAGVSARVSGAEIGKITLKKAIKLLWCYSYGVIDEFWAMNTYKVFTQFPIHLYIISSLQFL